MTTVSLGRSTPNRWRAHAALGTAAAAMVGVATVVVGAQLIGVNPPTSAATYASTTASTRPPADTSPYCTDPRRGTPEPRPGRSPARTPAGAV
jgi:hypothetical protein